jgi:hypothetical protein
MKIETQTYNSPIGALEALVREMVVYERQYGMSTEEFYQKYCDGQLEDSRDFVEWAGDYQQYLGLKQELEQALQTTAIG